MTTASPRTILIVDSDEERRRLLSDALSFMCWIPICATTPLDAVRVLEGPLGSDVAIAMVCERVFDIRAAQIFRYIAQECPSVGCVLVEPSRRGDESASGSAVCLRAPFSLSDIAVAIRSALRRRDAGASTWDETTPRA